MVLLISKWFGLSDRLASLVLVLHRPASRNAKGVRDGPIRQHDTAVDFPERHQSAILASNSRMAIADMLARTLGQKIGRTADGRIVQVIKKKCRISSEERGKDTTPSHFCPIRLVGDQCAVDRSGLDQLLPIHFF
jgi:hypothetical protein